jgi:hypothetical protein
MSAHTTITAGVVAPAVVMLTISAAGTVAVGAGLGNDFRLKLSKPAKMMNPAGAVDGQRITNQITHAGGSLSWESQYNFGPHGAPTLSNAGTDVIGFVFNASLGSWLCLGAALGF